MTLLLVAHSRLLDLSDFFQSDRQSLKLPLPSPLPIGSLLTLRPNGTKPVKGRRSGPFVLTAGDGTAPSFLGRLPAYLKHRMPDNAPGSAFLFQLTGGNSRTAV